MDHEKVLQEYYSQEHMLEILREMEKDICRLEQDTPGNLTTQRLYKNVLDVKRFILKMRKQQRRK